MMSSEEFEKVVKIYAQLVIKPLYCSRRVFDNQYDNFKFENTFNYLSCLDPLKANVGFYLTEYYVGSREVASRQKIADVEVTDIERWYKCEYLPLMEQLNENLENGMRYRR